MHLNAFICTKHFGNSANFTFNVAVGPKFGVCIKSLSAILSTIGNCLLIKQGLNVYIKLKTSVSICSWHVWITLDVSMSNCLSHNDLS
jgi:hypothetical protein